MVIGKRRILGAQVMLSWLERGLNKARCDAARLRLLVGSVLLVASVDYPHGFSSKVVLLL